MEVYSNNFHKTSILTEDLQVSGGVFNWIMHSSLPLYLHTARYEVVGLSVIYMDGW